MICQDEKYKQNMNSRKKQYGISGSSRFEHTSTQFRCIYAMTEMLRNMFIAWNTPFSRISYYIFFASDSISFQRNEQKILLGKLWKVQTFPTYDETTFYSWNARRSSNVSQAAWKIKPCNNSGYKLLIELSWMKLRFIFQFECCVCVCVVRNCLSNVINVLCVCVRLYRSHIEQQK